MPAPREHLRPVVRPVPRSSPDQALDRLTWKPGDVVYTPPAPADANGARSTSAGTNTP